MSERRAIIVGIANYDNSDTFSVLPCCVDDALAMGTMLGSQWEDDDPEAPNYDCHVLTSESSRITRDTLATAIERLFTDMSGGEALFYFSGHGMASKDGGYLVTQEADVENPGYPMAELLDAANHCGGSVVIVLDCCHSGQIGNITDGDGFNRVELGEGVTILAASTATQKAKPGLENSLFTGLLLGALDGGSADVLGKVSAASVYAYAEEALGTWDQRPVYKSHAKTLNPLRQTKPPVDVKLLRQLPKLFSYPEYQYPMDRSFEWTEEDVADPENVKVFKKFVKLRNARLLTTENKEDLYWVAMKSLHVWLTPMGRYYWRLADKKRI